jgi:hypothetical protein
MIDVEKYRTADVLKEIEEIINAKEEVNPDLQKFADEH